MKYFNRKAYYNYKILDKYIAGIVLTGSEVKSLRAGKGNIGDAYCYVSLNLREVWVKGMYIAKHDSDRFTNHEEYAERKLLLNKREILKLNEVAKNPGITIVPLSIFDKHGLIKMEIAVCQGKKNYDKRESIKEKDTKREIDRTIKNFK